MLYYFFGQTDSTFLYRMSKLDGPARPVGYFSAINTSLVEIYVVFLDIEICVL